MADWPSGAPGVFLVGRCTMRADYLRNIYKKWIVVNVRISFHWLVMHYVTFALQVVLI